MCSEQLYYTNCYVIKLLANPIELNQQPEDALKNEM